MAVLDGYVDMAHAAYGDQGDQGGQPDPPGGPTSAPIARNTGDRSSPSTSFPA